MIGTAAPNLFDRLALAFGRTTKAQPAPAALYPPQPSMGAGYLTFPGWDVLEREGANQNNRDLANAKLAVNSPWVYRNVNAIAKELSVANLVVKVRAPDGMEDVENHPLEQLWENPNPHMGRSFLMQFWTWQLLLSGEAYLYLVPAGGGITEIWPIPSWMIQPIPDRKEFIKQYAFKARADAEPIPIDKRYIVYSRLPNPFDIRRGLSPLVALMVEIGGDIAAGKWNANYFAKENATPTGLIAVPRDTLDTDLARVRMEIQDFFGQGQRRVAVARAGDLAWTPFQTTQKDMEFNVMRVFTSKLVDTAFGIPEGFWSKDATRANSEGAKATMIENAVWPHLVMLSEDLNAQGGLLLSEDERVEFDDIRPRNRALELQEFSAYQAVLTVDELRALIDKDEIGDPRGLMLVAEIGKGTPMPATPAAEETEAVISAMEDEEAAAEAAEAPAEEPPPEEGGMPLDAATPPIEEGGTVPEEMKAADEAWDRLLATPKSQAMLAKMADEARADMQASDLRRWETKALNTLRKKGRATCVFQSEAIPQETRAVVAAALPACRTPQEVRAVFAPFSIKAERTLDARIAAILARAERAAVAAIVAGEEPDTAAMEAALRAELQAALVQEVLSGVATQGSALGVTVDAGAAAAEWASSYVPGAVRGMTETTRDTLRSVITSYRETPMTRQQVIDTLAGTYSRSRAEMIADTELSRANSQATVSVNTYLRGKGLEYRYQWLTSNDERTCPICGPRDGTFVGEDSLPPAHPRCRCRSVNVRRTDAAPLNAPGVEPTAVPVRTFDDPKAADAFLRTQMGGAKLTRAELDSLTFYQGGAFETVNGHLRGNLPYTLDAKERAFVDAHIGRLDAVLGRNRLQDNMEVYRGMFVNDRDRAGWEAVARMQPGATFRDPAFMSTTVDPAIARRFSGSPYDVGPGQRAVDVKIRVPSGTPATYYNAVLPEGNAEERELLLGRDLTYRVISRTDSPDGRTVIEIEVMP